MAVCAAGITFTIKLNPQPQPGSMGVNPSDVMDSNNPGPSIDEVD